MLHLYKILLELMTESRKKLDAQYFKTLDESCEKINIHVWEHAIDADGFRELAKFIEASSSLKKIAMLEGCLSDEESIILFNAIKNNNSIEKLKFCSNLNETDVTRLVDALSGKESLDEIVLRMPELSSGNIGELTSLFKEDTSLLKTVIIDFAECEFSDKDQELSKMFEALLGNKSLTTLKLTDSHLITDRELTTAALCKMLKANTALKTLDISGHEFDDEQMLEIFKSLRHNNSLESLAMGECDTITIAGLNKVKDFIETVTLPLKEFYFKISYYSELADQEMSEFEGCLESISNILKKRKSAPTQELDDTRISKRQKSSPHDGFGSMSHHCFARDLRKNNASEGQICEALKSLDLSIQSTPSQSKKLKKLQQISQDLGPDNKIKSVKEEPIEDSISSKVAESKQVRRRSF